MTPRWMRSIRQSDRGQAMVLFAILLPTMVLIMALAVEGGRVWVENSRLQSAADMAALIGAQSLPCGLSDTTCLTGARTLACTYAANNGFPNNAANCAAGTDAVGSGKEVAANSFVPPQACAPFDFLDYGNNGIGGCKSKANGGVSFYDYIEVQLKDNLGTIPVFNIPVVLDAHAVARHGIPSTSDYAVNILSTSAQCGFDERGASGSYFVTGVTFSNSPICRNSGTMQGCDGGFRTAVANGLQATIATYAGASTQFAPPDCQVYNTGLGTWASAAADSPPNYLGSQPVLLDPHCDSLSPPTLGAGGTGFSDKSCSSAITGTVTKMSNCPDCNHPGFWWDGTRWHQGGAVSAGTVELFPGTYTSLSFSNGSMTYFNPGVYTFTEMPGTKFQSFCIYGAPACDDSACTAQSCDGNSGCEGTAFGLRPPGATAAQKSDLWYRSCSPYGKWDSTLPRPTAAAGVGASDPSCQIPPPTGYGPCINAPTWLSRNTDGSDSATNKPLNGVVIYVPGSSFTQGATNGHGNSAPAVLAAPDPCPGSGSLGDSNKGYWAGGPAAQWPEGTVDPLATFAYPATSYAGKSPHSAPPASAASDGIYPSTDWTLLGECSPDTYEVWPGEMPKGQHLHFLYFVRGTGTFDLGGNTPGTLTGIMYAPQADMDLHGNSGGSGPPFIYGQLVVNTLAEQGNDTVSVVYRPCNEKEDACASGLGTQLIQ